MPDSDSASKVGLEKLTPKSVSVRLAVIVPGGGEVGRGEDSLRRRDVRTAVG